MCGLAAFFEPGRVFSDSLLSAVSSDLYHRGPDSEGKISEKGFGLVFRRLAIIDPIKLSDQPMTSRDGNSTVIFNGEIYNYKQLRSQLKSQGIIFKTNSDTEVLLEGYNFYGEKILDYLEGMFSFIIIDRKRSIALAARDPFGIKPLYYIHNKNFTAFSSEMRIFSRLKKAEPDLSALPELLTFKWAAGKTSNQTDVIKVEAGTTIKVNLYDGSIKKFRYSNILDLLTSPKINDENNVKEALEKSIYDHLISDVGYSTQLSGGIDSSLITALASKDKKKKISTYGIKIEDEKFDESIFRDMVKEKYPIDTFDLKIDGYDYAEALPSTIDSLEGPSSHGGCVALWLLCKEIKKKHKVVLTGEGADELFGGYERYGLWRKTAFQEKLSKLPFTKFLPSSYPFLGIKRFINNDAAIFSSVYDNLDNLNFLFPDILPALPGYRNKITKNFNDFRDRLYAIDHTAYLESLLNRQDKISMASSIETRVPFVHLPLWKVVSGLPQSIRTPGYETKPVLKKIALKYLPDALVNRRKIGLVLPYHKWLSDSNGFGRYLDFLKEPNAPIKSVSEKKQIDLLIDRYRSNPSWDLSKTINKLINIDLWLRSFKNKPDIIS